MPHHDNAFTMARSAHAERAGIPRPPAGSGTDRSLKAGNRPNNPVGMDVLEPMTRLADGDGQNVLAPDATMVLREHSGE